MTGQSANPPSMGCPATLSPPAPRVTPAAQRASTDSIDPIPGVFVNPTQPSLRFAEPERTQGHEPQLGQAVPGRGSNRAAHVTLVGEADVVGDGGCRPAAPQGGADRC